MEVMRRDAVLVLLASKRPYSAFGARLYTTYLEGSTIAVTGSVSQEIRSHGRCQAPAECPGERAG